MKYSMIAVFSVVAKKLILAAVPSCIAVVLTLSVLANLGWGAIIASDSFNYTVATNLAGNGSAGSGWAGAWGGATDGSVTVQNPSPPLAVNPAVQLKQPNNNNAAYRMLSSAFSGNEVFVSFAFRFSSGTITSNDFMGFWVDNDSTDDHTTVPNIGLKAELGLGLSDYFVRVSGTSGVWSQAVQAQLGSTVQIVGKLWKTTPGENFDRYSLWVNPDFDDSGSPDITATGVGSLAQFHTVGIRTAFLGSGDLLYVDELRLATSWGDVVVPEPATIIIWSVLGLAGAGLGRWRRKRRAPVGWSPENRQAIHDLVARGTPR